MNDPLWILLMKFILETYMVILLLSHKLVVQKLITSILHGEIGTIILLIVDEVLRFDNIVCVI